MTQFLTKQGLLVDPNGVAIEITETLVIEDLSEEQPIITNDPVRGDDLTALKGIGEARQAELAQHGIHTFQQLAIAVVEELAIAMEVSPEKLAEWQVQASQLV